MHASVRVCVLSACAMLLLLLLANAHTAHASPSPPGPDNLLRTAVRYARGVDPLLQTPPVEVLNATTAADTTVGSNATTTQSSPDSPSNYTTLDLNAAPGWLCLVMVFASLLICATYVCHLGA